MRLGWERREGQRVPTGRRRQGDDVRHMERERCRAAGDGDGRGLPIELKLSRWTALQESDGVARPQEQGQEPRPIGLEAMIQRDVVKGPDRALPILPKGSPRLFGYRQSKRRRLSGYDPRPEGRDRHPRKPVSQSGPGATGCVQRYAGKRGGLGGHGHLQLIQSRREALVGSCGHGWLRGLGAQAGRFHDLEEQAARPRAYDFSGLQIGAS